MGLITEDMYREWAKTTDLNSLLKQLFSHLDTEADYQLLFEQVNQARTQFMDGQQMMVQQLKESELSTLPIYMIKDKASSSGGTFLRWRSMQYRGSGETVLQQILAHPDVPNEVRHQLVATEKDRVLINMQISILNFVLRQVSECREKIQKMDSYS